MSIITNISKNNWIEITGNKFTEGQKITFDVIQAQAYIIGNYIIVGIVKRKVTINRSKTIFKEVLKVV